MNRTGYPGEGGRDGCPGEGGGGGCPGEGGTAERKLAQELVARP